MQYLVTCSEAWCNAHIFLEVALPRIIFFFQFVQLCGVFSGSQVLFSSWLSPEFHTICVKKKEGDWEVRFMSVHNLKKRGTGTFFFNGFIHCEIYDNFSYSVFQLFVVFYIGVAMPIPEITTTVFNIVPINIFVTLYNLTLDQRPQFKTRKNPLSSSEFSHLIWMSSTRQITCTLGPFMNISESQCTYKWSLILVETYLQNFC